jgi:hypothetical protein
MCGRCFEFAVRGLIKLYLAAAYDEHFYKYKLFMLPNIRVCSFVYFGILVLYCGIRKL